MKRIITIIATAAIFLLASGCTKDKLKNELVGTSWSSFETYGGQISITILTFIDGENVEMSELGEEPIRTKYEYDPPVITLFNNGDSLSGTVVDDKMTFPGLGMGGNDMVFVKGK